MIRLSLCPFVEKNTRMWGKGYPPLSGVYTFLQKVSVSLFNMRRNFHRMWRQCARMLISNVLHYFAI